MTTNGTEPSTSSTPLVANPRARLRLETAPDGTVLRLTLSAPVRGRGLRQTVLDRSRHPALFHRLVALAQGRLVDDEDVPGAEPDVLEDLGLLVPADRIPEPLPFACPLLDPPAALVPAREADEGCDDEWAPARWSAGTVEVDDPSTGLSVSYVVPPDLERTLGAGDAAVLPPDLRRALSAGGLLAPRDRLAPMAEAQRARGKELEARGHCVVPGLLPPAQVAALRAHFRRALDEGYLRLEDAHGLEELRHVCHNDPLAVRFHRGLTTLVACLVGRPVRPSYCYVATYVRGSALKSHTDRPQCEYSISLSIDTEPSRTRATAWPLFLVLSDGAHVPVRLAMGDGLVYRGRQLPHYRHPLVDGERSTSIFFHYVDADFEGSLD